MTLSLSYKGEISPFGRDGKKYERWPRDKTIVFQEFLWGFDEHSEEKSIEDVKKALVYSMQDLFIRMKRGVRSEAGVAATL